MKKPNSALSRMIRKTKLAIWFILAAALLMLSACNGTSSQNNPQSAPPAALYVDVTTGDVDWAQVQIIIDGRMGIAANLYTADGEDFPTHIPLIPVANALGVTVDVAYSDPPQVTLEGRNGEIGFTVGSNNFGMGNQTVSLWHPSLLIGDEIYVPILFFRDVFGMGQAMWMGGIVNIDTEVFDDMH